MLYIYIFTENLFDSIGKMVSVVDLSRKINDFSKQNFLYLKFFFSEKNIQQSDFFSMIKPPPVASWRVFTTINQINQIYNA